MRGVAKKQHGDKERQKRRDLSLYNGRMGLLPVIVYGIAAVLVVGLLLLLASLRWLPESSPLRPIVAALIALVGLAIATVLFWA